MAKGGLSDYRGAIQDFNKVIEINPNSSLAYFYRGITELNLSQKESGCLDLSKAGEMGYFQAYDYIKQYCK